MSEIDHSITERDLARELGLSKEDLRELRTRLLVPGEFELGKRGMCLTPEAAQKLREAAGAPEKKEAGAGAAPLPDLGTEKKEGAADEDAGDPLVLPWTQRPVVRLFVKKCPANRKIVEACLDKELTGEVVRVRVNLNVNFIPRMEIKAKQEARALYVLVGRCPRSRGRF